MGVCGQPIRRLPVLLLQILHIIPRFLEKHRAAPHLESTVCRQSATAVTVRMNPTDTYDGVSGMEDDLPAFDRYDSTGRAGPYFSALRYTPSSAA